MSAAQAFSLAAEAVSVGPALRLRRQRMTRYTTAATMITAIA